ncbi:MAG TPA: RNA methyltransferase [Thermotogota bacterium]|nr:RNA methyltransferase [Thermotogota bacterium]
MLDKIYVMLIHYPCLGREKQIIATAVTNVDIHDIARVCRTYNVKKYYMVTNLPAQQEIVRRVVRFWTEGSGIRYNPSRSEALNYVILKPYIEDALEDIEQRENQKPVLIFTSAKKRSDSLTYAQGSRLLQSETRPVVLLFGTGWGLPDEVMALCDYDLEPVRPGGAFNHLSVRSAVSIILDRLIQENY